MPYTAYNLTGVTNGTDLLQWFTAVNTASGSILSAALVLVIFLVLFVNSLRYGAVTAMLTAGFVSSLISSLLFLAGGLPLVVLLLMWFITGSAFLLSFNERAG